MARVQIEPLIYFCFRRSPWLLKLFARTSQCAVSSRQVCWNQMCGRVKKVNIPGSTPLVMCLPVLTSYNLSARAVIDLKLTLRLVTTAAHAKGDCLPSTLYPPPPSLLHISLSVCQSWHGNTSADCSLRASPSFHKCNWPRISFMTTLNQVALLK